MLSWKAVGKATSYEVQVDNSSAFTSPEFTDDDPEHQGRRRPGLWCPGKNFWRIRATGNGKTSGWANGSFTVAARHDADPVGSCRWRRPPPATESAAAPVEQQPGCRLLHDRGRRRLRPARRQDLHGPDHVLRRHRSADHRRLVLAGDGQQGQRSDQPSVGRDALRHRRPSPAPQITYPANDVTQTIEDVVLDWTPVPGARNYDVQVALDARLQQHHLQLHQRARVRASPRRPRSPTTSSGGGSAPSTWPASRRRGPSRSTGSSGSGSTSRSRCTRPATSARTATVHPVDARAARVATTSSTSRRTRTSRRSLAVARSWARPTCHALNGDCGISPGRQPLVGGPSRWTTPTRAACLASSRSPRPSTGPTPSAAPGGPSISMPRCRTSRCCQRDRSHHRRQRRARIRSQTRTPRSSALECRPPRSFPGTRCRAPTSYRLDVPRTSTSRPVRCPSGITTSFPMVALRVGDQRSTLPESQAGSAYFWHVTAVRHQRLHDVAGLAVPTRLLVRRRSASPRLASPG